MAEANFAKLQKNADNQWNICEPKNATTNTQCNYLPILGPTRLTTNGLISYLGPRAQLAHLFRPPSCAARPSISAPFVCSFGSLPLARHLAAKPFGWGENHRPAATGICTKPRAYKCINASTHRGINALPHKEGIVREAHKALRHKHTHTHKGTEMYAECNSNRHRYMHAQHHLCAKVGINNAGYA